MGSSQEQVVAETGNNKEEDKVSKTNSTTPPNKKSVRFNAMAKVFSIPTRAQMGQRVQKRYYYSAYEMAVLREREKQMIRDFTSFGVIKDPKDDMLGLENRFSRYARRQRIQDAVCSVLLEQELRVQTKKQQNSSMVNADDGYDQDSVLALAEVCQEHTFESKRLAICRAKLNARQVGSSDVTTEERTTGSEESSRPFVVWSPLTSPYTYATGDVSTKYSLRAPQVKSNVSSNINSSSAGLHVTPNQAEGCLMNATLPQNNHPTHHKGGGGGQVEENSNKARRRSGFNFGTTVHPVPRNEMAHSMQQAYVHQQMSPAAHMMYYQAQQQHYQQQQHYDLHHGQQQHPPGHQVSGVTWDPVTCQYVQMTGAAPPSSRLFSWSYNT